MTTITVSPLEDGVLTCTLSRPEAKNAINLEMVRELHAFLADTAARREVHAVVFSGGREVFASGADVAELIERRAPEALQRINGGLFRAIEALPQPTVAAVNGYALGGGCELMLACDLRVCGASAKLGQPEVGLGILPGAGATYRLPRLVGSGWAKELVLTGRVIDAATAERIGLVNRVVPDDEVLATAQELARLIAAQSPLAVRLAKQAMAIAEGGATEVGMALESLSQAILFEDEDKQRRMRAFLDRKSKRKGGKPA